MGKVAARLTCVVAVAAYADLGTGYICTDKAYDEGGYEPSATKVGRGSEAQLKEAIVDLLRGKTMQIR